MLRFVMLVVVVVLLGCGGGGTGPSAAVASLTVLPAGPVLDTLFSIGATRQLNVTARDASGSPISGAKIDYSSSNQSVARVGTTGLITAFGNGTATISVKAGSITENRTMPVRQKVDALAVTPTTLSMIRGTMQTLTAVPRDARGNDVSGLPAATFQSLNASVASVSLGGEVSALLVGNTTITVSLTTVDGTASVNVPVSVTEAPLAATVTLGASSFNPSEVDIRAGGTVTFNNTSGVVHNVTFTGGVPANIGDHGGGSNDRTFVNTGTYDYRCTIHDGMTGRVVVH